MKGASKRLTAAGIASMYLEMPGCTHGNIADGHRVFGDAFSFLRVATVAGVGGKEQEVITSDTPIDMRASPEA